MDPPAPAKSVKIGAGKALRIREESGLSPSHENKIRHVHVAESSAGVWDV